MKEPFDQELLSAYLDGELTAAEQARVERLLAENPKAKQLLDELRALSATLQSLPQEKIGENLAPYVLRQAERELLTGSRPAAAAPSRLREMISHMLSRRALAWAGAAVAIAVIFTISEHHQRRQQRDRAIAIGQAPDKAVQAVGPADGNRQPAQDAVMAEPPARRPAIHPPGAAGEDDLADKADADASSAAPVMPEQAERASDLPAFKSSPEGKKDETILAESARSFSAPKEERVSGAAAPGNVAIHSAGAGGAALPVEKTTADQPAPPGVQDPATDEGMAASGIKSALPMGPAGRVESMDAAAQRDDAGPGENATGPDGVLVVRCDITPEAARNRTLDQLLLRNNIAMEDGPALAGPTEENDSQSRLLVQPPAQAGHGRQLAKDQASIPVPAAAELTGLDVIYVEAAPEQLEPVLAAMNAMPGQFLTVSVEPPPQAQLAQSQRRANLVANQYDFSRYNRAKPVVGAQQVATATDDLKSAPTAQPAAAPQSRAPLHGADPEVAAGPGKPGGQRLPSGPSQPSDKAQTVAQDGAGQATVAIGQQLRGFPGRAVRVQLPQKLPADEVARAATSRERVGKQLPGAAGVQPPAALPLATQGVAGPADAGATMPQASQPAYSRSGQGRADSQLAAPSAEVAAPDARAPAAPASESLTPARDQNEDVAAALGTREQMAKPDQLGKRDQLASSDQVSKPEQLGKPSQLGKPEPSAKHDQSDEPGRSARPEGLVEGGPSDQPEQAARADHQPFRSKAKTAPSLQAQQQVHQGSGIYRVLFVIRVVPDGSAAPAAQPAAEKSQAQE